LKDDFAHAVVVIDFCLLHAGLGGFHIAVGEESIPDGPGAFDSEEPAVDHVAEIVCEKVALVCLSGAGTDLWQVAGDLLVHACGLAEDELSLGLEVRVAGHSDAHGLVGVEGSRLVVEFADDIKRHFARESGRVVDTEQADEPIHRHAVVILGLDKRRFRIGKGDLGLEDIEARHGAGLVAVLLVFELLGEEIDGLLVGDDEGAIEDDFEEIDLHLRDNIVDHAAQAVVGLLLVREGRPDAGNHSAAIVDQLGEFHIHAPSLVVDIDSAEIDIVDLTGGVAVVRIH